MYEIERLPQSIDIGFTGEMDFRTVQIDMSEWVAKMPEGQPTLMHIRPGEYEAYPVEITFEDNIVTWSVSDEDLGTREGTGLLQVWFGVQYETEVMRQLGMSAVVATIVHLSIAGEGHNSSTVQIPWLKEVMELKNIILGYDYEAESWANGQRGGEDVGSDDPAYHNNAKYYKEQVEDMALDSEAFAAGTRGGEAVDEDDPAYHNNASYYNDQAALEAATAAAAAATASAAYNVNLLAPNYTDLTFPVKKGQPCIYSGGYYEALVDIATTEEWTSAHWKNTKVGAEVNNLKSAFLFVNDESSDVTGCRIAVWEDGKRIPIPSEGNTATLERNTASDSFCCVMDVTPGEIVHWAGSGGTNTTGVAYGFIDSENKVLSRSTASITNEERMTVAPDNAAKVIFNNRYAATKKYAYIGEQIPKKFDDFSKITTGIEAITNAEPAIFDTGFYYTTPANGSPVKKTRSSNFACAKLKVSPGDAVTINATGTTSSNRLYAFVDNAGNSIGQCATNLSGVRTIYAPEGAVYCVINNRTTSQADDYYAYKGIPIAGIKRAVSFNFRTGRINNDGTSSADTTRIRTPGYLKLGNRLHVHIPEGYKIKLFRFAGATYSSIVDYTDFLTVDCDIKTYPESYYRVMIGATDDGDISASAADGFSFDDYNGDIAIGSTGDTTDRKAEIEAYLNTYKKLRFEIGTYYVSGIEMPDYSIIEGSGAGSIIQLSGEGDGNTITLGTMCTVKNLQIKGRDSDWSVSQGDPPPSTPEGRNGIYIEGDNKQGFIENCYIHGFSGGAIVAYNTGTATNSGLLISSCYLLANSVGVYFVQKTEFNIVQNSNISGNYYGIIDNGANNTIVGCNISMSYYGFYHDMSDIASSQPNNMHGLLSNCEFKHINTRTIYINTTKSKFLLTGCQFGSSSEQPGGIELISAAMMQFTDCVASDNFPISVTNGGLTIFSGFFLQKPLGQITIVNNSKVKFINCFDTNGDPVVGS